METRLYVCEYCKKYFLLARRNPQKFCLITCKSSSHHQKTKTSNKLITNNPENQTKKTSIGKMSFTRPGNATIGSADLDLSLVICL